MEKQIAHVKAKFVDFYEGLTKIPLKQRRKLIMRFIRNLTDL